MLEPVTAIDSLRPSHHRMATTTVALDQQAYELLRRQKQEGESFSDVVKRLARPRRRLSSYAGAWKSLSNSELARIEAIRTEGKASRARRAAKLWGD